MMAVARETDVPTLFAAGNYTAVILRQRPDLWQTHAALALIGRTDEALAGLANFPEPQARFYEAVAYWMSGDELRAADTLAPLEMPHAQRLRTLISKPVLNVVSMLMPSTDGPHVILAGAAYDRKFAVRNVGFAPGDIANRPGIDARTLVDPAAPPDFFVCTLLEWHQIPSNLKDLPCPTLGQTGDYDLHIQAVQPWLSQFDELIVTDHSEYADVAGLTTTPVTTFPKSFGHPPGLPVPRRIERPIDVFLSGTLFAPAHPDKAQLLHALLGVDGLTVVGINGFLETETYRNMLARTKVSVAYCRHAGATVTRGIESASMGCVTLVQEGSALALAVGPGHGLVFYPNSPEGMAHTIREVFSRYPEYEERAWRAVRPLRAALAPGVVGSQYLRYCTVLAARPRPPRVPNGGDGPVQKRVAFWKGTLPAGGDPVVAEGLRQENARRWERMLAKQPAADPVNELARERLLTFGVRLLREPGRRVDPESDALRAQALTLYRDWLPHFPQAPVARFNFLRAAAHFGTADDVTAAWNLLSETLRGDPGQWTLGALDDVFPYDWGETHFNARAYLDAAVRVLCGDHGARDGLIRLLIASASHYIARLSNDLDMARQAVALDPDYPWYRLDLAKRLAARENPPDNAAAASLLTQLARQTAVAVEAVYILRRIAASGTVIIPDLDRLIAHAARIEAACIDGEDPDSRRAGHYHRGLRIGAEGPAGPLLRDRRPAASGAELSVVFVDPACHRNHALFAGLNGQTLARSRWELIYADPYSDPVPGVVERADVTLGCGQVDFIPHTGRAGNAGLLQAAGRIVLLLASPPPAAADYLAAVLAAFPADGTAKTALVQYGPAGEILALAAPRADLLAWSGFDEHEALARPADAFGHLARRIASHGGPLRRLCLSAAETTPAPAPWQPDFPRRMLWPGLAEGAAPSLLRASHLLTVRGLQLCLEGAGLNVLHRLTLKPGVRRDHNTITITPGIPAGHVLYGPYLTLPGGRFCLTLDAYASDVSITNGPITNGRITNGRIPAENLATPILSVEVAINVDTILAQRTFLAVDFATRFELMFQVPDELGYEANGGLIEFRVSHYANATIELRGIFVKVFSETPSRDPRQ
jgi:hypothetical protein